MNIGGELTSDNEKIGSEFNHYFSSVPVDLRSNIPDVTVDPLSFVDRQVNSIGLCCTDQYEIGFVINGMENKKGNLYAIPNSVYKLISDLVSRPIADLVNESFSTGVFPNILKIGRIIPIHKNGNKHELCNYRPISTLHFVSKIFERVMYSRLSGFFNKYDIFSDMQFGFRRGLSTADAVLRSTDVIYEALNRKSFVLSVLVDLSRAFDTVDHGILLGKLEKVGIRGRALDWLTSYLSNRKQCVVVGGVASPFNDITIGVPQGSILGPLLFTIYINDMQRATDRLTLVHYADDTTALAVGDSISELCQTVNDELAVVDRWLCANKLSLNIAKTSYMLFSGISRPNNDSILIRNRVINRVRSAKFLGVILDENLNFKTHVDAIRSKVSKSSGVLYRLSYFMPRHVLRNIYISLVYPYLCYCIEVWGGSCKTECGKLSTIQNKCFRSIYSQNPTPYCYHEKKLFLLNEIYSYFILLKFYKYYVLNKSIYFSNKVDVDQVIHGHVTRSGTAGQLIGPFPHCARYMASFHYRSVVAWNLLTAHTRTVRTINSFKELIRSHILGGLVPP